uniref:U2 snRNP-associated SURP motif-containing protein n=1 Tax=Schistosoma haematobium TaxID=6185 RepID=A0A095B1V4_SCHHA
MTSYDIILRPTDRREALKDASRDLCRPSTYSEFDRDVYLDGNCVLAEVAKEEEHTQQVFEEFVATFEEPSKSRAWVKGGVVNPSSGILIITAAIGSSEDTKGTGRIYRPVSKLDSKLNKTEEQNKADFKKSTEKPPALGKRKGQEQKKSKLEQFKEELKLIQQQREQRHALRQGRNQLSTQSDLDLSDVGMRNREYRRGSSNNQGGDSGMGFHKTVSTPPSFYSKRSQNDRHDGSFHFR